MTISESPDSTLPKSSESPAAGRTGLEPMEESFPSSHKIYRAVEHEGHVMQVPARRIHLTGDNGHLDVYDTSGPQGHDVRKGLPAMREEWIKERVASNETGNRRAISHLV